MSSQVKVESDGTIKGTVISVDGRPLKGVRRVTFDAQADKITATCCIDLTTVPLEFFGGAAFRLQDPDTGAWRQVKSITFVGGETWEAGACKG
ncbi:MAG TPA: hypothetical protein VLF15_05345 [Pseudoxanthomonas sp.]|nr:hypothetical protein [Pseudoxanthomonas sp.]